MEAEQRQHQRYDVLNDGFEIFSRHAKIHGKLENISLSGMAFRYTPVRSERAQSDAIDIMTTGPARFYLSELICRKIYDISALSEDQSFTGAETRICGMEFVRIRTQQKLAFFLKNYLVLPVESLSLS